MTERPFDRNDKARKKRVALIVHNPKRDLPSMALIAFRLAQDGVTTFLVPSNLREREIYALAPDFVLFPNLRRKMGVFSKTLKNLGIGIGVLDTEPTFLNVDSGSFQANREFFEAVDLYCGWSEGDCETIRRDTGLSEAVIELTGLPRIDFLKEPLRKASRMANPISERYGDDIILINGKFPFANSITNINLTTMVKNRYDMPDLDDPTMMQKQALKEFSGFINNLAARMPSVTFIYRPHPFENSDTYSELLDTFPNLHLETEGSVDRWLNTAKALIQTNCATAIEAGIVGIPALSADWIDYHPRFSLIDGTVVSCASENDVVSTIEAILKGEFQIPETIRKRVEEIGKEWFFSLDGQAHERVCMAIIKVLAKGKSNVNKEECLKCLYQSPAKIHRRRRN